MKKSHVLGLLLLSVALSHALAPAIAWAQAKAQTAFYSLTVTDTITASGDVTADQYVASGSASQYSCSKTDATCLFSSATADGTTSTTVAPFTFTPSVNVTDGDLVFNVENSAGTNLVAVNEQGRVEMGGANQSLCLNGATCSAFVANASSTNVSLSSSGVGVTLQGTGPYFYPSTNGTVFLGLTINRWADVKTVDVDSTGTGVYSKASGDALTVVGGGYARFTFNAGAPTATDCDAAGESGRIAIDTSNNRFYFCNGAAWQYVNEDVP